MSDRADRQRDDIPEHLRVAGAEMLFEDTWSEAETCPACGSRALAEKSRCAACGQWLERCSGSCPSCSSPRCVGGKRGT